jgi:hypothetical protein
MHCNRLIGYFIRPYLSKEQRTSPFSGFSAHDTVKNTDSKCCFVAIDAETSRPARAHVIVIPNSQTLSRHGTEVKPPSTRLDLTFWSSRRFGTVRSFSRSLPTDRT